MKQQSEGWIDQDVIRLILCNPACWNVEPVFVLLLHPKVELPASFNLEACLEHCTRHLVHNPCKGSHLLDLVAKRPTLLAVIEEEILSLRLKPQMIRRQKATTALGLWPMVNHRFDNLSVASATFLSTSAYLAPSKGDDDPRAWIKGLSTHDVEVPSDRLKKLLPSQYIPVSVALLSLFPAHSEVLQVALSHLSLANNVAVLDRYAACGVPNTVR